MYKHYDPNPHKGQAGDCVIRAICKVYNLPWVNAYAYIAAQGLAMGDMPSSNRVWGAWLKEKGCKRLVFGEYGDCTDDYTVRDFCNDFSHGKFITQSEGHVVAVVDGDYFDTWDSGNECVYAAWEVR